MVVDARPIRIATRTLSDTRTLADDEGGRILGELLQKAGFAVVSHDILREDPALVAERVRALCDEPSIDTVILTGGTGIAPRDTTIEAIAPLLEKEMTGFGEAFRRLSWDQVGARSILSRAIAGVCNRRVVIALPGSVKAVTLATEALIAPMLAHAVALASGRNTKH